MFDRSEIKNLMKLYKIDSLWQPWQETGSLSDFLEKDEVAVIKRQPMQFANLGNKVFLPKKVTKNQVQSPSAVGWP